MEPEINSLEVAIKALAILSVIPSVIFALWSQYFTQDIEALKLREPKFDASGELEKIRVASLCVLLFQVALYLGSSEVRHAYPLQTELIFVGCVLLQLFLQFRTEQNTIPPVKKELSETHHLGLKIVFSWAIGTAIYVLALWGGIKIASWAGNVAHLSVGLSTAVLFVGGGIGTILGLGINYALGPFHLKKIFPTEPLQDPDHQSLLKECFIQVGLPVPEFRVIQLQSIPLETAFLTGLQSGRGPFRQTLFLAKASLQTLSFLELRAVILNQISHILLHHSRKRFFFSLLWILSITALSILTVILSKWYVTLETIFQIIGPAVALVSFIVCLRMLSKQNQKHEDEADLYSVQKLEVQFEDLVSALRKLPFSQAETEKRIHRLTLKLNRDTSQELKRAS